jgi:hypothetical protein
MADTGAIDRDLTGVARLSLGDDYPRSARRTSMTRSVCSSASPANSAALRAGRRTW